MLLTYPLIGASARPREDRRREQRPGCAWDAENLSSRHPGAPTPTGSRCADSYSSPFSDSLCAAPETYRSGGRSAQRACRAMSSINSEVFVIRKLTDSESVMRGAALLVISVPLALPDQAPLRARSPGSQETAV